MLTTIKADSSLSVQFVMFVSLWGDAVKVEVSVCAALDAGSAELEHQFKPSLSGPLFLTFSH